MKRFLALASAALVLSASATLVAGSIVINGQPAQAEHEVVN
ncbi:hypothetical protein [Microcoleus sp. B3-D7]